MKRIFLTAVVVLGALMLTDCGKETEKIIERVEVQKGNLIHSGYGAPETSLGDVGDYYLDLSTSNLYGAKTTQGWGSPIVLRGKDGDNGKDGKDGKDGNNGNNGKDGKNGNNGYNGKDGSKIYSGNGAPQATLGKEGDWYLDAQNKRFYGPKGTQSWGDNFVSLMITPPVEVEINATLDVEFDSLFQKTIYPSLIYSMASLRDVGELTYFDFTINSNKEFEGKIRITNDKFIRETIEEGTIHQGEHKFSLNALWKYDDFINFETAGYTHFKFELINKKNDKVLATKNIQLSYRSINECVYALKNKDGEIKDFRFLFASYVNEDSRLIDAFLSRALANHNARYGHIENLKLKNGWAGYQGGRDYVHLQVLAIVSQLTDMGMQYSNITDTSDSNTKVYSQYVRLINESLSLQNANCVDGSVLLASILEKIGIRCFLFLEPGHMYLAYSYIDKTQIDSYNDLGFVETTLINTGIYTDILANKTPSDNAVYIGVKKVRAKGIKPLQ